MAETRTYSAPGIKCSFVAGLGAREAMVDVKEDSSERKRAMILFIRASVEVERL